MADTESIWPTKDIVYVSIVGSLMLAALFEWLLWLAAFLYCLWKVFKKAENISTRLLAFLMMIVFTLLRYTSSIPLLPATVLTNSTNRAAFLPVMIVTLPLPNNITSHFPQDSVRILQWFAFWTFAGLLIVPWILCIYQLITHSIGRTPLIRHILGEATAPKVVIVMPCYKEVPEILLRTVNSLVECDYPSACLHIFLSFDGDQEDGLYLNTLARLGVGMVRRSGFPTSIDVPYRNVRVTVSRFPHGGKQHCQKRTFKLIERIYNKFFKHNDNVFVLFIDSDCILDKVCIQNFMYEMELKPGINHKKIAMTGVITATTEKNSLLTLLQDVEYIHGQLFERSVESACGAVTCLPGALTILRFSAFRKLAKFYFARTRQSSAMTFLTMANATSVKIDGYVDSRPYLVKLTHLFMVAARYGQIGISTGAFCKTEAVQTYKSLLKQRRRWFLGFITNEVCMLTDKRIWMKYPFLCIIRLAQNTIRTTALLFFIMVISLLTTSQKVDELPVGFIAVSLGLNWALMAYFAASLGRFKILLYPVLFVIGPFFNWLYMVYGIFTAGQRTWGGPRADAGQADEVTSPQDVVEYAHAIGEDRNIVPESFRPAVEARARWDLKSAHRSLQPSQRYEERMTRSAPKPLAWGDLFDDSDILLRSRMPSATIHHIPLDPRASISMESLTSAMSTGNEDPEMGQTTHQFRLHPPMASSAHFMATP